MTATWPQSAGHFEPDGSLRDIYVNDVGLPEWEAAFRFLCTCGNARFTVDGADVPLPGSAEAALAMQSTCVPLLTVETEGISYCCHFISPGEIELDLLPQDINSGARVEALQSFVRGLGQATRRDVVVTHENQRNLWIVRYELSLDRVVVVPEQAG